MTNTNYCTRHHSDHTRFGGLINYSDYDIYPSTTDPNGYHSMASIAERIEKDLKFDEQCRKNIEQRKKQEKYKKGSN